MNEYLIQYSNTPDWSTLPILSIQNPYLDTPDYIRAWAQICWGDDAFHVHLWSELPSIRAVETGPIGAPCEDSCLEFFFQPVQNDPRYMNFEFNINTCMYLGIGTSIADLVRLIPEDVNDLFFPTAKRTEAGWELFYQIPYRFIRRFFPNFAPKSGDIIRANCFACADFGEPPFYLSWNPVTAEEFTFHHSESFGLMKLSKL